MKNSKETIRKFVNYLNNPEKDGGYWLPNIQRSFVWKEEQIERLFDSILREYPIGTLLVWKTKRKIRRRKFIDNYKKSLKLTDSYIPVDDKVKMLVLDGQQRLQSFFIGLKGSYENNELVINILSGDSVAPDDIKYKFKFIKNNEVDFPWVKIKEIVFSNKKHRQIGEEIIAKSKSELSDFKKDRIKDNIDLIKDIFTSQENLIFQEVDSVDNPELYSEDEIVEIFIRANSGGTQLGKSDLLFSLLTSSWEEADEKMEELLEKLNKTGYNFSRDFTLKTCLAILNKGAAYKVEKFRDKSTREKIIENWDEISNAIKEVKDFIYGKTFLQTDKTLPSYLVLIPLIYFKYYLPDEWKKSRDLNKYLLRTLLTGAFSGSPDGLIDKCTKKIKENKNFNVDEIFEIIRADGRNLEVSKDTIINQHYLSKEIHLLFNIWYGFNYQPSYENNKPQIDHIFPQSALKRIKDINPNTDRKDILRYKRYDRDQIANLMLLTAKENGSGGKSDTLPEEWFKNKGDDYLDLHLIPKDTDLWKIENFEKFIIERKRLILDKFEHFMFDINNY